MATMRISVLRKNTFRSPFSSFSRFCSSNSNDGTVTGTATGAVTGGNSSPPSPPSSDGEEAKGALKSFMATSGTAVEGEGLWAKLRRDAMPDKSSEARPWTTAGGARPQSSASAHARQPGGSATKTGAMAPRRSPNPRTSGPARKPSSGGSSNFDGGSAPGAQYLGGTGSGGKRSRNAAIDEELMNDTGGDEEIPPEVVAILEEDRFIKDIEDGKSIDTRGMDVIDAFFANVYIESHKTSDGIVREAIAEKNFRRTRLPQPRPIRELVGVMTPKITHAPPGSEAYRIGSNAWGVLSKNPYFTEPDKAFIANGIARMIVKVERLKVEYEAKQLAEDSADYHEWGDEVFSPTFRKGFDGYLLERKLARLAQAEGSGPSMYSLGETDWDQEAVVDEDDLFFDDGMGHAPLPPMSRQEEDYSSIDDDFFDEVAYKNRADKK